MVSLLVRLLRMARNVIIPCFCWIVMVQLSNGQATVSPVTLESVLRAVQERVYALVLRDAVFQDLLTQEAVLQAQSDGSTGQPPPAAPMPSLWQAPRANNYQPLTTDKTLIQWPGQLSAFPLDGDVKSIQQAVAALNMAEDWVRYTLSACYLPYSVNFDQTSAPANPTQQFWNLSGPATYESFNIFYTYMPGPVMMSLPPLPRATEQNWREVMLMLASQVNQFKALAWPTITNTLSMSQTWDSFNGYDSHDNPIYSMQWPIPGNPYSFKDPDPAAYSTYGGSFGLYYYGWGQGFSWGVDGGNSQASPDDAGNGEEGSLPPPPRLGYANLDVHGILGLITEMQPQKALSNISNAPNLQASIQVYSGAQYPWSGMDEQVQESATKKGSNDGSVPSNYYLNLGLKFDPSSTAPGFLAYGNSSPIPSQNSGPQGNDPSALMVDAFTNMMGNLKLPSTLSSFNGSYVSYPGSLPQGMESISGLITDFSPKYESWNIGGLPEIFYATNIQVIAVPNFTSYYPDALQHVQVAPYSLGTVEVRCAADPVRIHLGRGINDLNQTAWISPRFDGFILPQFVGSQAEFELLYQTDSEGYLDMPIQPANSGDTSNAISGAGQNDVTKGTFDIAPGTDFSDAQKQGSGWDYISYLQAWHLPRLRQVRGGDILADIQCVDSSSYKMKIDLYWIGDLQPLTKSNGLYPLTGKTAFKTILIYNPTISPNLGGLPTDPNHLMVVEDSRIYYEASAAVGKDAKNHQGIVWSVITSQDGNAENAYSTTTATLVGAQNLPVPSYFWFQGDQIFDSETAYQWCLVQNTQMVTSETDLQCQGAWNPSMSDYPVILSAVFKPDEKTSMTITNSWYKGQYSDPSATMGASIPCPWGWGLTSTSMSGPSTWKLNGTYIARDTGGAMTSETHLLEGAQFQTDYSYADSKTTITKSLGGGSSYSSTNISYSVPTSGNGGDNFNTENITTSGSTTSINYDASCPIRPSKVVSPAGFVDAYQYSYDSGSSSDGSGSSSSAKRINSTSTINIDSTYQGASSTIVVNGFGGLVSRTRQILNVNVADDEGQNPTPWGQPTTISHLNGTQDTLTYTLSAQIDHPYGSLVSVIDALGCETDVAKYNWLNQPSSWTHSVYGTFTPDYSNVLQDKINCSGKSSYTLTRNYSAAGEFTGAGSTRGSGYQLDVTPGKGSLTVGGRQIALDQDATGAVTGAASGLGSRGMVSKGWSIVEGKLCHTEQMRTTGGSLDYIVETSYDALGRVVSQKHPSPDGASQITDAWTYDSSGLSVTYTPGSGGIAIPITETLDSSGAISTTYRQGVEVSQSKLQAGSNGSLEVVDSINDDSNGNANLTPISTISYNAATESSTYTPWGLSNNTVTQTTTLESKTISGYNVSGGPDGNLLSVNCAKGQATSVSGTQGGIPFTLTPHFNNDLLGSVSGNIGVYSVELVNDSDGQLQELSGPGFDKVITKGGGPGYTYGITDNSQGSTQSISFDAAGNFSSLSGTGLLPLSAVVQDQGGGVTSVSVNNGLTQVIGGGGEVLSKSYTSGHFSEDHKVNSDGTLSQLGTGGDVAKFKCSMNGGKLSTITTWGNQQKNESYYLSGPRASVSGPEDQRSFTYVRGNLAKETHYDGVWADGESGGAGTQVIRKYDDGTGLYKGTSAVLDGSGASGATQVSFYNSNQVKSVGSALGRLPQAAYSYNSTSGQLATFSRGPLQTTYTPDLNTGKLKSVSTSSSGGRTYSYSYGFNQRGLRNQRIASFGQSWSGITYTNQNQLFQAQLSNGTALAYHYDGQGNCSSGGTAVTYAVNGDNQAYQRIASLRGYGLSGTAAAGTQIEVFHPLAPHGQSLPLSSNGSGLGGKYSAFWPLPNAFNNGALTPVEMLVQGTLPHGGPNGQSAVSQEALWVIVPPNQENFKYNDAGQLIADASWTYTWDDMGRLTGMNRTAGTSVDPTVQTEVLTFQYDADGRRTMKTQSLGFTARSNKQPVTNMSKLLWDGWLPICEEKWVNGTLQLRRWFTWGRDVSGSLDGAGGIGGLVCIEEEGTTGRTLLPVEDGLGNITAVYDIGGNLVATYDYGPYGESEGSSGDTNCCPFQYQSKYTDVESGLCYFGYRYYSSKMCRWISRDPMGEEGGFNLYAYCNGDPVNGHDLLGTDTILDNEPPTFVTDPNNSAMAFIQFELSTAKGSYGRPARPFWHSTGKYVRIAEISKDALQRIMHPDVPYRDRSQSYFNYLRSAAQAELGAGGQVESLERLGGLVKLMPGGTTGADLAEGNYGRAVLHFGGDVVLTLSGAKLLKSARGAAFLMRSGAIAGAGGFYNTVVDIGGARYDAWNAGIAYGGTWAGDASDLAWNTGRSGLIGVAIPWAAGKVSRARAWRLGPVDRGRFIEKAWGQNLPENFLTFDRFEKGVATSIKSFDLNLPSFWKRNGVWRTGKKAIDAAIDFERAELEGVAIDKSMIKQKIVRIAIPNAPTATQAAEFQRLAQYGADNNGIIVIWDIF